MTGYPEIRRIKEQKLLKLKNTRLVSRYSDEILKEYSRIDAMKASFSMLLPIHGTLLGRIIAIRNHGKITFWDIEDASGILQIFITTAVFPEDYQYISTCFDLGDIISVSGEMFRTKAGELTLKANQVQLVSKSFSIENSFYYLQKQKYPNYFTETQKLKQHKKSLFLQMVNYWLIVNDYESLALLSNSFSENDQAAIKKISLLVPKLSIHMRKSVDNLGDLFLYSSFTSLETFLHEIETFYKEIFYKTYEIIFPDFDHLSMIDEIRKLTISSDDPSPNLLLTETLFEQELPKVLQFLVKPAYLHFEDSPMPDIFPYEKKVIEITSFHTKIGSVCLRMPEEVQMSSGFENVTTAVVPHYICKISLKSVFSTFSMLVL